MPDRIPVHWNAAGEVDGYGGRFMGLLLIPLITLGMHLLFMAAVYAATTLAALGHHRDMAMVIAVLVGLLFIVLGAVMRQIHPNWFVGVRTPWTLSSELSWTKTHRLAGWLFAASGVATLVCGILRPGWGVFTMLATILPSTLALTIYSYVVWRNDPAAARRDADVNPAEPSPRLK